MIKDIPLDTHRNLSKILNNLSKAKHIHTRITIIVKCRMEIMIKNNSILKRGMGIWERRVER
jgi:hypothetical protein